MSKIQFTHHDDQGDLVEFFGGWLRIKTEEGDASRELAPAVALDLASALLQYGTQK